MTRSCKGPIHHRQLPFWKKCSAARPLSVASLRSRDFVLVSVFVLDRAQGWSSTLLFWARTLIPNPELWASIFLGIACTLDIVFLNLNIIHLNQFIVSYVLLYKSPVNNFTTLTFLERTPKQNGFSLSFLMWLSRKKLNSHHPGIWNCFPICYWTSQ